MREDVRSFWRTAFCVFALGACCAVAGDGALDRAFDENGVAAVRHVCGPGTGT